MVPLCDRADFLLEAFDALVLLVNLSGEGGGGLSRRDCTGDILTDCSRKIVCEEGPILLDMFKMDIEWKWSSG